MNGGGYGVCDGHGHQIGILSCPVDSPFHPCDLNGDESDGNGT